MAINHSGWQPEMGGLGIRSNYLFCFQDQQRPLVKAIPLIFEQDTPDPTKNSFSVALCDINMLLRVFLHGRKVWY